jgi:sensor histidine kinase YesM
MKLTGKYSILIQVVAWMMYFIIPFLMMPNFGHISSNGFKFLLLHSLQLNLFSVVLFYVNFLYLVPRLLFTNQIKKYILVLLVLLFSQFLMNYTLDLYFLPKMQFPKVPSNTFNGIAPPKMPNGFFKPQLIGTLFSFFLITILSTLMALFLERIKNYEEKKQIQFEKTAAELSALKLQISPHFLFNTLNNIRWLARKKSDLTEDAIVKLATLLRYIIYQANEQKVALVLEINNLKDFIGLQEMRIGNNTSVSFEVSGLVEDYEIEPLLFIPFVENAFKYGVSDTADSEIQIVIKLVANVLIFKVSNSIFRNQDFENLENTGLGIENVRQRLSLLYPHAHTLNISENDHKFTVSLRIELINGEN